jgi:predicted acyltransferase
LKERLPPGRVRSVDALRGLTFLVMVFVNQLSGVSGIPAWARHMPADADAMSFVDVVFPAFLFVVGLSIPLALAARERAGDSPAQVRRHVAVRALALIVMGYFMVNAEEGFNAAFMPIPISLWALLSYLAFALVWGRFRGQSEGLRLAGIVLLLLLAAIYRGGADGQQTMTPQWWGILGLIGWAYLVASLLLQWSRGRIGRLLVFIVGCVVYYALKHLDSGSANLVQGWLLSHDGHAAHTSIVLCGVVCALWVFDPRGARWGAVALFTLALIIAGWALRPLFPISKIHATPSWCFFSAAWCIAIFALLWLLVERWQLVRWTRWIEPAATNPLVLYLVPFVIEAVRELAGFELPAPLSRGATGALWAAAYAVVVMALVALIDRIPFRMRL